MNFQRTAIASAIALLMSAQTQAQQGVQELDLTTVEAESIERDAVIEVFDINDIDNQQIDDFEDMVSQIPGVSVSRGDDRWGASGFNIRGLDEDRVAMNVDGVPQGETLKYEGGQAYGYFKGSRNGVDMEALKAVEIVKGADALFSGSGALAGAVNMTTKDPDDYLTPEGNDFGFSAKAGYRGVNDETMFSLSAANRSGNLESLLVLTRRNGHEFENYDMDGADIIGSAREIPDPQEAELDSVLMKFIYALAPGNEIGVVGSYYDQNRITETESFNGGWYSGRVGDDTNTVRRIGLFHNYEGETPLFDRISTAINSQENSFEARTSQTVNIAIPGFPAFDTNENRVDIRSFDQELLHFTMDMEKQLGNQNLLYGLELQDKEFQNTQFRDSDDLDDASVNYIRSNIGALIPHSEADVFTLYGLDTLSVGENTQLRVGLRYDDYTYDATADASYADGTGTLQEVSFNAVTWTLGIEQALNQNYSIEAGVSSGFRAPTIEDMYSTSGTVDDWSVIANPDLQAESSTNLDIALVGAFESGDFRIGAFYSSYDDFIDYELVNGTNTNTNLPDPNGYRVPSNSNEVDMKGLEFSAGMNLDSLVQGLNTRVQAAYTDGEEANGDPVYSVQPFNLSWNLGYNAPAGNWGVNARTSFTKAKDNSDSFRTDETTGDPVYPLYLSNTATIVDLIAYYSFMDNLRVSAGIYNLTDKEYYTWDSVRFIDQGDLRPGIGVTGNGIRRYSEPGRNFEMGVTYNF